MLHIRCFPCAECRVTHLALILVILLATSHSAHAATGRDEQAVADVQAGRVDMARASWWGFEAADATQALQAALNSRARQVIVDNTGDPWIVTTITLPSDKEIILESGVVVEAKRGKFLGKSDCLFVANGQKHLAIRGNGAILRMHKDDYHHPPYEPAEWRHTLSLGGCEDVTVEGLTLQQSGGDGIYLGAGSDGAANVDITIRHVICDGNNRQGISVITAENLLIEDCVFRRTGGTAPQAGIDFEPNLPEERLVNCVVRNCRSEGNAGCGYLIYLGNMSCQSTPVSLRFDKCISNNCQQPSTYVGMTNRDGLRTVKGSIEFIDCRFEADQGGAVIIRGNEADGCLLRLQRCAIICQDKDETRWSPIAIEAPPSLNIGAGNIEISDCVLRDAVARSPISLIASPLTGLPGISGSLTYVSPAGKQSYAINEQQLAQWFPQQGRVDHIPPFAFSWQDAKPLAAEIPTTGKADDEKLISFRLRSEADLLVWGRGGEPVTLVANLETVGQHKLADSSMSVTAPDGDTRQLTPAIEGDHVAYNFTPPVSGTYRLQWRCGPNATLRPLHCSVPWTFLQTANNLHLFRCTGTLFFTVPAGVERFAIQVSGEGTAETIKATVRNTAGQTVGQQDNIALPYVFIPQRDSANETEIWSLTLEKASTGVLEDVTIRTLGIPPVFATSQKQVFAPQHKIP